MQRASSSDGGGSSRSSGEAALHRRLARALLLLLSSCLLLCAPPVTAVSSSTGTALTGPPAEVRVGVLAFFTLLSDDPANPGPPYDPAHPRNISDYNGFGLGPQEWIAVKQRFRQINADPTILPHTNITWTIFDDQFLSQRGFFGALEAIRDHGAQFLMGASGSSTSQNAATVAQQYGMPILSWAASSPLLSDKRFYPTFMRVCHSDSSQSIAMAWISKYTFGWNNVAIIYTNDLYGTSGAEQFAATTRELNMTLLSSESILKGGLASNFAPALSRVAASGAKILIYFGQDPEWQSILQIGPSLGLFNNDTVWIVDDAIVSAQYTPEQQEQMLGVLGVAPDGGGDTPEYQQWAAQFVNPASPWRLPTDPPEEIFSGGIADVSFYSAFANDAASFAARALHDLIYTQGRYSFTGAELQAQLASTTIDGISGHIALDSNFDRKGVNFVLSNLQKDGGTYAWRSIGVFTDKLAMLPSAPPIRWRDGTNNKPSDLAPLPVPPPPPQSLLGPKQFQTLVGLSVFGLCIIAILAGFLFVFRATRVMHAASPVMLGVVLFGGMLVCLSVLLSAFPQGVQICGARVWLFNLGFTFAFGALLLKTYRVDRIFHNSKLVVQAYNDVRMLKMLSLAVGFDVLILSLRSGLAPYMLDEKRVCVFADGDQMRAATALTVVLIVSKALAVLWGAWLSYQVRDLPQLFQESTYVALSIYNTLLLCAAWLGVRYGVDLHDIPKTATLFESGLMLACGCITLLLIFAPKILDVITSQRKTAYNAHVRKQMKLGKQAAGGAGGANRSQLGARNSGLGFPNHAAAVAAGSGSGGGGSNNDSTLCGQTPDDIKRALLKVAATNRAIIDKSLDEIRTLEERIAAKKRNVQAATDLCYQIQCEQDYFNQVRRPDRKSDMTDNDLVRLFEGRIAEFNTANDKAGAGHLGGGGGGGGGGGAGRKNKDAVEMTSFARKTNNPPPAQQQSTRGAGASSQPGTVSGGAGSSTGLLSPSASGSVSAMRAPGNIQRALPPTRTSAAAAPAPASSSQAEPAVAAANASSLGEVQVEVDDANESASSIPPQPQQPVLQPTAAGSSSAASAGAVGSSARNSLSSTSEGAVPSSPPPLSLSAASAPSGGGAAGARKLRMHYNPALATRMPKIPAAGQMQAAPGGPASPSQSSHIPQEESPPSV